MHRHLSWAFLLACFIVALLSSVEAQPGISIGSIKIVKNAAEITRENLILTRVVVTNNGSIPVEDFEIFEYFNNKFVTVSDTSIIRAGHEQIYPIQSSPAGAQHNQFVIQLPQTILGPGENFTMEYWTQAPGTGDFQIPTTIVFFSSTVLKSVVRINSVSNGLLVHIPSAFELAIIEIWPYAISAGSLAGSATALLRLRKYL